MSLPAVRGHREARALLARAAIHGNLAQSVLLHGPPGVGKERLGLWLAQLLLCEAPDAERGPCDRCRGCRLALRLEHPDLHWFFPLPRPDAGSPEKLREKLEDLRAAELAARRETPHHVPSHDRPPAHFLGSIQTLQRLAAVRPSMGRRKVFVVGDAELMVPQESSPEAANAFLKLLEEPPADTTLILTSSQPGGLLPTIRSRVLPLRLAPLEDQEVAEYLREEMDLSAEEAERVAARAHGAVGRAIRMVPSGGGPGSLARRHEAGRRLLLAALSRTPVQRLAAAHEQAPAGARGEFAGELEAMALWVRDLMAVATGAADQVRDPEARALLERAVQQHPPSPLGVAGALVRIASAQELAQGNVNPQLILADLLAGVHFDLYPSSGGHPASSPR